MKKYLFIILFGIITFGLAGCYTQIAMQENDDSYTYSDPAPIIIIEPAPPPVIIRPIIGGPHPLPNPPQQPVYKTRKPIAPPRSNVRKRDDIRNSGGRNEGGKRNRR